MRLLIFSCDRRGTLFEVSRVDVDGRLQPYLASGQQHQRPIMSAISILREHSFLATWSRACQCSNGVQASVGHFHAQQSLPDRVSVYRGKSHCADNWTRTTFRLPQTTCRSRRAARSCYRRCCLGVRLWKCSYRRVSSPPYLVRKMLSKNANNS